MNYRRYGIGLTVLALLFSGTSLWIYSSDTKEPVKRSSSARITIEKEIKQLQKAMGQVHDFHQPFKPTSWSKGHGDEKHLSLAAYINSDPNRPNKTRTTLYLQPIGDFTKTQTKVMRVTADVLSRQFHVPVKTLPILSLDVIPPKARRVHPTWKVKQILSTYVLDDILKPRRPDDAVAVLAMTTSDLWPGKNWNFVFGQASLRQRVGVWSLSRYGDPDKSEAAYQKYLLRTLKVATHETGHMFGIPHCVAYQCGMNGSNNLQETDEGPLAFCPECSAKLWWSTKASPEKWYQQLSKFAEKQNLDDEAKSWKKCHHAVQQK